MNNKRLSILLVAITLLCANLACSLGGAGSSNDGEGSKTETLRIDAGGFSFEPVPDYQMQQFYGMITLAAPDSQPEVGPSILLAGGPNQGETNDSTLQNFLDGLDAEAYSVSSPKKIKVDGVDGIQADLEGTHQGVEVAGRVVIANDSVRAFTMMGVAPKERWNKDLEKHYEAVFKSLVFFEPDENGPESNLPQSGVQQSGLQQSGMQASGSGVELRQWAAAATASSEYEAGNFSAQQMTGEPDTPACGDFPTSWSAELDYTSEWARLTYITPVIPTEVNIYQTFNPTQVVQVNLIDDTGSSHMIYQASPVVMDCPYLLSIPVVGADYYAISVEILLDQSVLGISWNEIDAVELVGYAQDSGSLPEAAAEQPDNSEPPANQPLPPADNPEAVFGYLPTTQYWAFMNVMIGQTYTEELPDLFGEPGREETGLKPRPDSDKTFSFDLGDGKKAFIAVTTSGMVYKKSIPDAYYPNPDILASPALYEQLVEMFADTGAIPYETMAEMLGTDGFPMEVYLTAEDELKAQYSWTTTDGYYISGFFVNGVLTGAWGLSYGNR